MTEALPFKTTMTFTYGEPRRLAPGVERIVANNPNHFTFKGTNTYLIGADDVALIDPGPDDPAHLAAIARPGDRIIVMGARDDTLSGLAAEMLDMVKRKAPST